MCDFAPRNSYDFSQAILGFVRAQAGLIPPQPRIHFDLSAKAETRAAPAGSSPNRVPPSGAANAFDLDACFATAPALELPERIVEVRK